MPDIDVDTSDTTAEDVVEGSAEFEESLKNADSKIEAAAKSGFEGAEADARAQKTKLCKDRINEIIDKGKTSEKTKNDFKKALEVVSADGLSTADAHDALKNAGVDLKEPNPAAKAFVDSANNAYDNMSSGLDMDAANKKIMNAAKTYGAAYEKFNSGDTTDPDRRTELNNARAEFDNARAEHGKAYDAANEANPDATDDAKASGEDGKNASKYWGALKALAALGIAFLTFESFSMLAEEMSGCYKYDGVKSTQLRSCHGKKGLKDACKCGKPGKEGTIGGQDGTCGCGPYAGAVQDCGGQVYCPKCEKCTVGDGCDAPTDACACAPGPACNDTISYQYKEYNAFTAVAGLINTIAHDAAGAAFDIGKFIKKYGMIIICIIGVFIILSIAFKVLSMFKGRVSQQVVNGSGDTS